MTFERNCVAELSPCRYALCELQMILLTHFPNYHNSDFLSMDVNGFNRRADEFTNCWDVGNWHCCCVKFKGDELSFRGRCTMNLIVRWLLRSYPHPTRHMRLILQRLQRWLFHYFSVVFTWHVFLFFCYRILSALFTSYCNYCYNNPASTTTHINAPRIPWIRCVCAWINVHPLLLIEVHEIGDTDAHIGQFEFWNVFVTRNPRGDCLWEAARAMAKGENVLRKCYCVNAMWSVGFAEPKSWYLWVAFSRIYLRCAFVHRRIVAHFRRCEQITVRRACARSKWSIMSTRIFIHRLIEKLHCMLLHVNCGDTKAVVRPLSTTAQCSCNNEIMSIRHSRCLNSRYYNFHIQNEWPMRMRKMGF